MGIFGPPNIEKMKAKRNVKGLIKAMSYKKDRHVRTAAAKTLGEIGDAWAIEPLVAILKDEDCSVRNSAAIALGKIGDARAVEPLIAALKDKDQNVRTAAAGALGEIGDARAAEPLIAALKDDDDVREAAASALRAIGKPAVEPLIAALENRDTRKFAADLLQKLGWKPDCGEAGAWYWIAKHNWTQAIAIGSPAVKPLLAALKDEERGLGCESAVRALGEIGDTRSVEPLVAALKDSMKRLVRVAAAEALGKINDARTIKPLIAALKSCHQDVRKAAAGSLVKIGEPAIDQLIAVLKDMNETMRRAAADALQKLGWKPDRGEAGAWYWIAKHNWTQAIAIGSPAVKPLISALKDVDRGLGREAIAQALGEIGELAINPLIVALRDEDVCHWAIFALDKLGWKPDKGEAGAWYWVAKRDWEKASALGSPAVEPLIIIIKDVNLSRNVRQGAARVLVRMYREGALDEQSKKLILAVRKIITYHHDESPCAVGHSDSGIGVDFQL